MGTIPIPKRGWSHPPQFSVHVYCGQTIGWIKMALGVEDVGLGPGHIVLDGDQLTPQRRGQSLTQFSAHFWATVCKTVCPMLSDRCLSCPVLSVCDVRALWPNGWTDREETWRTGRPWSWPHCVRWEPSSHSPKRAQLPPIFGHMCCGQMATWIKMSLGMELGLGQATLC